MFRLDRWLRVPGLVVGVLAAVALAAGPMLFRTAAQEAGPVSRDQMRQTSVREQEGFWKSIAFNEPSDKTGCRKIIGYALALAEARQHPDRLGRLLDLLARMQDRHPGSKTYGNLRWTWRDTSVTDQNAVEFCMQDALLFWLRHRDWMPEPSRRQLSAIMQYGAEGCMRHRVPSTYTNIAMTSSGNLILLGDLFGRPDVAGEGDRRLTALVAWTESYGTHEFCSPTYYGIDINALTLIATYAQRDLPRRQADALLRLVWTDIAANWFPAAERLGGTYSRTYDVLSGLGALDWYLWVNGWFQAPTPGKAERIEPYWNEWTPPASLKPLAFQRLPRLVRESWGDQPGESRTAMFWSDVSLSCLGAGYGPEDVPLAMDLPGPRDAARCYFLADGRDDPYGKKKFEAGVGKHSKATHLTPFWIGAQRTADALAAAVYRDKDLKSPELTDLESHLVVRRDAQAAWLQGTPVDIARLSQQPGGMTIAPGQSLVLRYGTAAVGVRVLLSTTREGRAAPIRLVDDGNPYGCLRLTLEHGLHRTLLAADAFPWAAAGLWVRVGSGLTNDAALDAWRQAFDSTGPTAIRVTARELHLEVPGVDGPLSVTADAPFEHPAPIRIVPEPSHGVLELDGQEIGRPMLAGMR